MAVRLGPFTSGRVTSVTGVTYKELDHWTRRGVIRPSVAPARGSGSQRCWTFIDLIVIALVRKLRDAGVELEVAGFLGRQLQHPSFSPHASVALALADGHPVVAWLDDDAALTELVRTTDSLVLIRLEPIVTELLTNITARPLAVASTSPTAPPPQDNAGEVDGATGPPASTTSAHGERSPALSASTAAGQRQRPEQAKESRPVALLRTT